MASENFAEALDSQEKASDRISSFIEFPAIFPGGFPVPLRRNSRNISAIDRRKTGFVFFISSIHNQTAMSFVMRSKT